MPKSKTRERARPEPGKPLPFGGKAGSASHRLNVILTIAVVGVLTVAAYWWWSSEQGEARFLALVPAGQAALTNVETQPDLGRTHLAPGQTQYYATPFPTSGPHETTWTQTGFYADLQPPTQVVHALEHGNIVIYYDSPGAEVIADLKGWVNLYSGQWDGIVVIPSPGLGQGIVMTAWRKIFRLDPFDPAAAAAFIDAFRGRGPEHPVR
jgi:hypothetical protein